MHVEGAGGREKRIRRGFPAEALLADHHPVDVDVHVAAEIGRVEDGLPFADDVTTAIFRPALYAALM